MEKFNVDHTISHYFKYNVGYDDDNLTTYHEWTKIFKLAQILNKQQADELFSHMINKHCGENYSIIEIKTFEEILKFKNENFK